MWCPSLLSAHRLPGSRNPLPRFPDCLHLFLPVAVPRNFILGVPHTVSLVPVPPDSNPSPFSFSGSYQSAELLFPAVDVSRSCPPGAVVGSTLAQGFPGSCRPINLQEPEGAGLGYGNSDTKPSKLPFPRISTSQEWLLLPGNQPSLTGQG